MNRGPGAGASGRTMAAGALWDAARHTLPAGPTGREHRATAFRRRRLRLATSPPGGWAPNAVRYMLQAASRGAPGAGIHRVWITRLYRLRRATAGAGASGFPAAHIFSKRER
jgi:hypothetical protein